MNAAVIIEPQWLTEARRHEGVTEIKGPKHNGTILGWLSSLRAWWKEDETPWCGVFVANCINVCGVPLPKYWMRAKDWLGRGVSVAAPCVGAVVVFTRDGGGHVGFVVGKDARGNLMVLGGNQGDAVNIKPFAVSRAAGYRWPSAYPSAGRFNLPVLDSDGKLSENEA